MNFRMACSRRMLVSAVLVLIAIKSIPTVTSRRTNVNLQAKFNFDFDASFSKPIFTKYFYTYDCDGENDCPGLLDTTTHMPIKNREPTWKISSIKASGEYEITQTNISFLKNEKSFNYRNLLVTGYPKSRRKFFAKLGSSFIYVKNTN